MRLRHWSVALAVALAAAAGCGSSDSLSIRGAGATFPAPVYKRWFLEYYKRHPDVRVNYQAIGSGAGRRQFRNRVVSFGASDAFPSAKEIAAINEMPHSHGLVLLPMTAGSIVLCYNVPGAPDDLRLTREAYVGIFLGEIKTWNHEKIAEANPGRYLPDHPIFVVRRAESSGTTHAFTNHLSTISPQWKAKQGGGPVSSIPNPVGIAGKGNAGVAALVKQTPGAIGYLEYSYGELAKLPMAHLQNRKGEFIKPSAESGALALAKPSLAKIPDNLHVNVPDPEGEGAYPLVTCTWLLCARQYDDARVADELKKVLRFCLTDGQEYVSKLGYLPLPAELREKCLAAVEQINP
jgi:phosphate transport system substrate-binding protein